MTLSFWSRVEFTTKCWNWIGNKNPKGYGRFYLKGIKILAHRQSYELYNGIIPEGLQIDHLCRDHSCVNPAHLEAVTQQENIKRGLAGKIMLENYSFSYWEGL